MLEQKILNSTLVIILFSACWVGLSWQYVSEISQQISDTRYEQHGVNYHRALVPLIKSLQIERGLRAASVAGEAGFESRIIENHELILENIGRAEAASIEFDKQLQTRKRWADVKRKIKSLPAPEAPVSPAQALELYASAIHDLITLLQHTADTSNLTVDPEMESYYLMELNVQILPRLSEYIGQIRAHASVFLAREEPISFGEQRRLLILRGVTNSLLEHMDYAYKILKEVSPHHRQSGYLEELEGIQGAQATFYKDLEELVSGHSNHITVQSFFQASSDVIESYLGAYDHNAQHLYSLLQDRINRYEIRRLLFLVFSGVVLLAIVVFYMFFRQNYAKRIKAERGLVDTMVSLEKQVIQRTAELAQNEKNLRTLLNTLVDGVVTIDEDGTIKSVNPAMEKIFGYEEGALVGMNIRALMPEQYRAAHDQGLKRHVETGEARIVGTTQELEAQRKDGHVFPVFVGIGGMETAEGKKQFVGLIRDITDQKEAQKDLLDAKKAAEKALQEAERANQVKTDFLANMSHELRTPLNSILGMTRLLRGTPLDNEQKEMAATVFQSSTNLLEIVNDILDLSKIEAGEVTLEKIGFDLSYVMKSTCHALELLANEKKLKMIKSYKGEDFPYVMGDPTRLNRVLHNLVGNAIKYTLTGHVEVRASYRNIDDTHIEWVCEIVDTGVGIPEDKLDCIFDKFTQADISTTRKFGGTGLGLAITKQLVELMEGRIEVESTVGEGSTFRVLIPFEITESLHLEKRRRVDIRKTGKIPPEDFKVLIAEDHPMNKLLAEKIMQTLGFPDFDIVETGLEVLEALKRKKYDIILMDCHMPDKNGYDTTEDIRKAEEKSGEHLPIVAMTANAMVGDREKCLRYGMDDYVSKPIDLDELQDILSQWVKFPETLLERDAEKGERDDDSRQSVSESPPVDLSMLDTFTNGDHEMEEELINLFLSQSDKNIKTLEENCTEGKNEAWREAAHQFKGGAANVGAAILSSLCAQAQEMEVSTASERSAIYQRIQGAFKEVRTYLEGRRS